MKRPPATPERKQSTPQELLDDLLGFLQHKFYPGHAVSFAKDRRRLLDWVVLWPARWLDERGVTLPADQYRQIVTEVLLDALRLGNTGQITYLPAYLAKVIQSHFQHHGDEIYARAKSMRTVVEHTLLVTGRLAKAAPDPVRDLATAARLLKSSKPQKRPVSAPVNTQLNLL